AARPASRPRRGSACGRRVTSPATRTRQPGWPTHEAVDAAIEAGALGARMTGGGFGGSVIVLVPADRADQVRSAVTRRFTMHQ
ncbi:MAG: hypothetical protein WAK82_18480, partial [Streptosporangiaceae bacterium]